MSNADKGYVATPVWDLPTRVLHWLLALLVGVSWWTGEYGYLDWHRWSGYGVLGLVLFRIYWGFAGSSTARFSHFLRGPGAVWVYSRTLFKRLGIKTAGHNPMGGWSVIAMLLLLLLQTAFGLFAIDVDGIESGPLTDLVSFDTGRQMAIWHGRVVDLLLILIAIHIAVVLHYLLFKRDNLISAMLTGIKHLPPGMSPVSHVNVWRVIIGVAGVGLVLFAIVTRFRF